MHQVSFFYSWVVWNMTEVSLYFLLLKKPVCYNLSVLVLSIWIITTSKCFHNMVVQLKFCITFHSSRTTETTMFYQPSARIKIKHLFFFPQYFSLMLQVEGTEQRKSAYKSCSYFPASFTDLFMHSYAKTCKELLCLYVHILYNVQ